MRFEFSLFRYFVFETRKSRVTKPVDIYKIEAIFDARVCSTMLLERFHTCSTVLSIPYIRVMIECYVDSVWTVLLILCVHNTPSSPSSLRRWNIKSPLPPRLVNIGEEKKLKKKKRIRRIISFVNKRRVEICCKLSVPRWRNYSPTLDTYVYFTFVYPREVYFINRNWGIIPGQRKKILETMGLL